jgi:multicomponent K+:H+ antiporter subunit E
MRRWLPYPLLWALLVAMWLALNETLDPAHVILGAAAALAGVLGLRLLQPPRTRLRRPRVAAVLLGLVFADVVRSNVAVAGIVLGPRRRPRTAGFVEIPLQMRHPVGLAALACIITSTPGTSWAGYDPASGVLTMHVLDLVDREAWVRTIKDRYERRLAEIFAWA